MSLRIFLFFFFLSSFAHAIEWKSLHLVNGCRIYTMTGKMLRTYPGFMCIFLDDGSFLSSSETHIRLINKNSEIIWQVPGAFHHQMNLSPDGKKILTLDSTVVDLPEGKRRSDVPTVISMDGKILHQMTSKAIITQTGQKALTIPMSPDLQRRVGIPLEMSHFNSIYEIPAIKNKDVPPYLKEGNLIVNGTNLGFYIMTPDLKKVLFNGHFPSSRSHWVHDVRVKENGHYHFFNNVDAIDGHTEELTGKLLSGFQLESYSSSVQEYDPYIKKLTTHFRASPASIFFSWICGNAQELNDDITVFSHYLNGTFVYSRKQKKMLATVPGTHADGQRIIPSQEIHAVDLTKFLSHW